MIIQFLLYIDPGIGSLAAQVILAGFAAFIVFFKNSFRRFFSFWKKDQKKENKEKISE
ncbi:MAG: hypothetical protein HY063_02535 [Bacteroidetes bacterium]|nr:hypothetical protein [Bacteroidota bacterium]